MINKLLKIFYTGTATLISNITCFRIWVKAKMKVIFAISKYIYGESI